MPRLEEIYWRAECSFAESHKHGDLAAEIGVPWVESVGIVAALYGQVRRQFPDGNIAKVSDAVLRRWCHSRKVTLDALKASGWVDADGKVHGWDERYSVIVEKREAERDRKRKQRVGTDGTLSRECPANVPPVPPVRAFGREGEGYTKEGEKQHAPKRPAPPADPRIAEVRTSYETAYEARYGYRPPITDGGKLGAQIRSALKAVGGADPVGEITALLGTYFDLSESDEFYRGAPLGKMLGGDTLAKLRAPAVRPRGRPAQTGANLLEGIDLAKVCDSGVRS